MAEQLGDGAALLMLCPDKEPLFPAGCPSNSGTQGGDRCPGKFSCSAILGEERTGATGNSGVVELETTSPAEHCGQGLQSSGLTNWTTEPNQI